MMIVFDRRDLWAIRRNRRPDRGVLSCGVKVAPTEATVAGRVNAEHGLMDAGTACPGSPPICPGVEVTHDGLGYHAIEWIYAGDAADGPLDFQWRRNGAPVSNGPGGAAPGGGTVEGADLPTLSVRVATRLDSGQYDAIVTSAS